MEEIIIIDGIKYHTNSTKKHDLNKSTFTPRLNNSEIRALIPGQIVKVYAKKGKKIKADQPIISFEAMKMINEITLETDIIVDEIMVKAGNNVEKNQLLLKYHFIEKK